MNFRHVVFFRPVEFGSHRNLRDVYVWSIQIAYGYTGVYLGAYSNNTPQEDKEFKASGYVCRNKQVGGRCCRFAAALVVANLY